MKYRTLFLKIRKDVAKFVVCCSCDWRFKGKAIIGIENQFFGVLFEIEWPLKTGFTVYRFFLSAFHPCKFCEIAINIVTVIFTKNLEMHWFKQKHITKWGRLYFSISIFSRT